MRFPAAPLLPLLMPLLLLLGASALTGALDCSVDDLCTSGGEAFCPGQAFYPPDCMPNACTCAAGGGLKCTKMACVAQCSIDADCAGDSDFDADGDGYDWSVYGGTDCNDQDDDADDRYVH